MMAKDLFADTIYAVSSGGLPSGVAVIRISGRGVPEVVAALTGQLPAAREAILRSLRSVNGEILDRGLVLYFPAPASYTGEHCAEFHVHGGRAVVAALLADLAARNGLRHAEAGEFTRRAFLNGKIDLTGAEALADLIASETEAQRRLAIENAAGSQAALYAGWRAELLAIRTIVEVDLDFADEGDVPETSLSIVRDRIEGLTIDLANHRAGYRTAELVRDGFRVVLIGAPNVGKSSLLNAIAKRDVAIVTDIPGTTRDLVEVSLDLIGNKVILIDTAGLRDGGDLVEQLGMDRARQAARRADLILSIVDQSTPAVDPTFEETECETLLIGAKADLGPHSVRPAFTVSSRTGDGLGELLSAIGERAAASTFRTGTVPSRIRHVECLADCEGHLQLAAQHVLPELVAEELRLASHSLGKITGAVEPEELLGAIFSEFCIGK